MKKIGLLALAIVLALGALGIGYAAWTDTVTISGTVNTGTVDLQVTDYSGTWAWKVPGAANGELVITTENVAPANALTPAVAYGYAAQGGTPDEIVVTFDNLFPCIDFQADATLTYVGTVPVKINDISWNFGDDAWIGALIASGDIYATARNAAGEVVLEGYQLHQNDTVHLVLHIHIPQDNTLMSKSGSFNATVQVVQWNEYPLP